MCGEPDSILSPDSSENNGAEVWQMMKCVTRRRSTSSAQPCLSTALSPSSSFFPTVHSLRRDIQGYARVSRVLLKVAAWGLTASRVPRGHWLCCFHLPLPGFSGMLFLITMHRLLSQFPYTWCSLIWAWFPSHHYSFLLQFALQANTTDLCWLGVLERDWFNTLSTLSPKFVHFVSWKKHYLHPPNLDRLIPWV